MKLCIWSIWRSLSALLSIPIWPSFRKGKLYDSINMVSWAFGDIFSELLSIQYGPPSLIQWNERVWFLQIFWNGKKCQKCDWVTKENSLVGGGARTSLEIRIDCFVRVCYSLDWGGGEYKIECFYVIGLEKIWVDCPTQLICIWIFICVPWQS